MQLLDRLTETVSFIRSQSQVKPKIGIILGSGLGSFVQHVQVDAQIPFQKIPHFVSTSV